MAPVTTQAVKQVLGDDHLAASDVGIATVTTEAVKQVLTTIPSEEEVPAETLPPSPGLVQVQAPKTAIQAARGASLVQKLLQKLNHAFEPPASTDAPETSYDPAPKAVVNQTLPAGPAPIPAVEVAAPRDVAPTKAVIMISPSPEAALPMAPSAGPAEIAKEQSEPQFELGDGLSAEDKPSIEIPILDETLEAPLPVSTKEAAATVRTPEKTSGTDRPEPLQRAAEEISDVLALRLPGRVTIRLNPEELGSLTIVVKHSAGQVSAEISATNDAVRAQLSSHRHELAASLEQRGHQLSSFQVTAEPPASSLSDKGQQFSQHSQSQPHLQKEDFERMARLAQASHPAVPQSRLSPHSSGVNVLA
jgi:flagellar hook-length control protein FliK